MRAGCNEAQLAVRLAQRTYSGNRRGKNDGKEKKTDELT